MNENGDERRLSAILAADVVGYTKRMEADTDGTVAAWKAARADIIDPTISNYSGRIVKHTGDGFLAEFPTVLDAVGCAIGLREKFAAGPLEFRMGVNLGDIIDDGVDIHGEGVNIAARIEALAEPGGISISGSVHNQVLNRLDYGVEDMGEVEVKNVARPVRVYRLLLDGQTAEAPRRPVKAWKRPALAAAAIVLLAFAGGTWWWQQQPDFEPADQSKFAYKLPEKPSIAVLPFDNMTGDKSQDYIGDGLTENIIAVLSGSPDLFIIARNSSFTYKNKPVQVQEVAERFGVRYVLEGSVQRAGDRIRVTAQLVDAVDGRHLWAERYDREFAGLNLFDLHDDITQKILEEMQVKLTIGEQARTWREAAGDPESYREMVQGRAHFQESSTKGHFAAEKVWSNIYKRNPSSSMANNLMGWIHWQKVSLGISKDPNHDLSLARKFAEKSLSLIPNASAHLALAMLDLFERKHDEAIANVDRALELAPAGGDAHWIGGWVKSEGGLPAEGVRLMKLGMRYEPDYPEFVSYNLIFAHMQTGEYDDARRIAEGLLASKVKNVIAHTIALARLAVISVFEGDLNRGREYIKRMLKINSQASVEDANRIFSSVKNRAFVARYLDALRQAGLPENPPTAKQNKPSIAVLPFTNMSGDKDQEYFADGMTDDLITDLSKVSGLMVIARNSAFSYKGKNVKVQDVAKDLNVSHVLEGSVRRAGGQVRINAQLIDGKTGAHLWAETFDRRFQDIFKLQDEVAARIVDALQVTLTPSEQDRLSSRPTANTAAYEIYLKARKAHLQFSFKSMVAAFAFYREAIDLDPNFADAHAGDASLAAHAWGTSLLIEDMGSREARARYERSKARALALDPENAKALLAEAGVLRYEGRHAEAVATARRVVSANPNNAPARLSLAFSLVHAGQIDGSLDEVEAALRLDPKPNTHGAIATAFVFFVNRKYEKALKFYSDIAARASKAITGHEGLIATNAEIGRMAEAKAAIASVLRIGPGYSWRGSERFSSYWQKDLRERWIGAMRKAGVPEWPFGFQPVEADRLSGAEIKALWYGHRINGTDRQTMSPFDMVTANDGGFVFRIPKIKYSLKGTSHIEGDRNCFVSADILRGEAQCWAVYRIPSGTRADRNEYAFTTIFGLYHFSVVD